MIDRIIKNEERLDKILLNIQELEKVLTTFKANKKDIYLLNKYYGSKKWFKDKTYFEENNLKIKAGVLSEDAVWNMLEEIDYLIKEMKDITKNYDKNKL